VAYFFIAHHPEIIHFFLLHILRVAQDEIRIQYQILTVLYTPESIYVSSVSNSV